MDIKPLLAEAERLLKKNPRDDIHDLSHHQRVWENVEDVLKTVETQVNKDALKVATMWHDVMVTAESLSLGSEGLFQETMEYLSRFMEKKGYDQRFRAEVLRAVKHHNFLTKHQMTLEGKLLFDADKLDAFNPVRYRRIIAGIKNKKLSKVQIFLFAQAAKVWLKTARNRYHFEKSRQQHDKLIRDLLKDTEAVKVAKSLGVDIKRLVS